MAHNILFVDDEPQVLKGLERGLYEKTGEWDMRFASSGFDAKAALERQPADIIVTDYRMPGMNGANLLDWVRRYYPGTVRFMLSGQFDTRAGLLAVPVAHQLLSKPCEPGLLMALLERACNLQKVIPNGVVKKVSAAVGSLPHNPEVYSRLSAAMHDDRISVKVVAAIIEEDLSLTMKVLQLANSSFFTLTQSIESMEGAIQSLGFDLLQQMVLAVEVFQRPGADQMAPGFSRHKLQQHALLSAQIARTVLAAPGLAYSASVAALLHDIGQLVLASELPEAYGQVLATRNETDDDISTIEHALLGTSHEEVGAYLAGLWGFPDAEVQAILHHHRIPNPAMDGDAVGADGKVRNLDLIVILADYLADERRIMPAMFEAHLPRWNALAEPLKKRAGV